MWGSCRRRSAGQSQQDTDIHCNATSGAFITYSPSNTGWRKLIRKLVQIPPEAAIPCTHISTRHSQAGPLPATVSSLLHQEIHSITGQF